MGKIEENETRLDEHDVKLDNIDKKVDVIDATTKGTASAVGNLIKHKDVSKQVEGTINKGDWRGTFSAIVATLVTVGMTAWSLWSIMYGEVNPFIAYLSIVCQPTIYLLVKTITGQDIKKNDVMHQIDIKKSEISHKNELDKMQGVMQLKTIEVFGLKEKLARLEERAITGKEIIKSPTEPKLPPV